MNTGEVEQAVEFGPFLLHPESRTLIFGEQRVPLGSRAYELLAVLASQPGVVVSNRELMARVWPGQVIEEGTLRVHILTLRRKLEAVGGPADYIDNVPGRGYCFVYRSASRRPAEELVENGEGERFAGAGHALPFGPSHLIGRDTDLLRIDALLDTNRVVTITGAGGIGKTAAALEIARRRARDRALRVVHVDMAQLERDRPLLFSDVAAAIGEKVGLGQMPRGTEAILYALESRPTLLMIETAECAIEAVAGFLERIAQETSVLALVTSREPLRLEAEACYRLACLDKPVSDETPGDGAGETPAVRLFLERLQDRGLEVRDEDLHLARKICCRIEGLPLALEVVATQVPVYGLGSTERLLDILLEASSTTHRRLTARHESLIASLEWSLRMLPARELETLRLLSIFEGDFGLESGIAVLSSAEGAEAEGPSGIGLIGALIGKSLIEPSGRGDVTSFRLLNCTRRFLRERGGVELRRQVMDRLVTFLGTAQRGDECLEVPRADRIAARARTDIAAIVNQAVRIPQLSDVREALAELLRVGGSSPELPKAAARPLLVRKDRSEVAPPRETDKRNRSSKGTFH